MFLHSDRGRCSTHQHQPHSCRQWSPEDMYRNTHPPDLYRHLRFDMGWKHTHLFPTHNVDLDVNEKDIPCNSIGVLQFKNFQFNVLYYKWHYMYVNRCSRGEVLTCESIWTATCKVIHFIHTESFIQTWRRAALIHLCLTHQAFQRQNITQDTHRNIWNIILPHTGDNQQATSTWIFLLDFILPYYLLNLKFNNSLWADFFYDTLFFNDVIMHILSVKKGKLLC